MVSHHSGDSMAGHGPARHGYIRTWFPCGTLKPWADSHLRAFALTFSVPGTFFCQITIWLPITQEVPGSNDTFHWKPTLPRPICCYPPLQLLSHIILFIFVLASVSIYRSICGPVCCLPAFMECQLHEREPSLT